MPTLESEESVEGEWVGRVRELKNSVKQVKEKLEECEKARSAEVKELRKQLKMGERRREEEVKDFKEQSALESARVEKLLKQVLGKLSEQQQQEKAGLAV